MMTSTHADGFRSLRKRGRTCLGLIISVAILGWSCSDQSELGRLKSKAKRGDPEAQFALGLYYYDGLEVTRDFEAAGMWFRRAALQGHAGAQLAMGKMWLNAEAGPPDEVQGANWIRTAAAQGYAPAQTELALLYSDGIGVVQDSTEALNWATKAAEQGYIEAQYHLGCFLSATNRDGVHADFVSACAWFSLAAEQGDQESQEALANLTRQLTPAQREEVRQRADAWKRTQQRRSQGL